MNAAISRSSVPARLGVGELAVALGRAMEQWGHRHLAVPLDHDALVRGLARDAEGRRAARATRELVFRATWRA